MTRTPGFNRELRGAQRIFQIHYGEKGALEREFPGGPVQILRAISLEPLGAGARKEDSWRSRFFACS